MKKLALIVGSWLLPAVTFAQATGGLSNVEDLAGSFGRIVDILIPTMFGLAILVFFYGLVRYIFAKEDDKAQAKKTMLWGVIAIFVMASIWGIVNFIGDTLGIDDNTQSTTNITLPTVTNPQP